MIPATVTYRAVTSAGSNNYEVTLAMAMALGRRGYRVREDFLHLVFPLEEHDERAWGRRLHLPVQLGLGTATAAQRRRSV
jgi:hypothetical protein